MAKAETIANTAVDFDIYSAPADTWLSRSGRINDINYVDSDYIDGTPVITEWRITIALDDIGVEQFTPPAPDTGNGDMPAPMPTPQPEPPRNYTAILRLWTGTVAPTPESEVSLVDLNISGSYHAPAGDGSTVGYFAFRVPDNIVGSWGLSTLYTTAAGAPQQVYRSFGNSPMLDTSLDTPITRAVGLKLVSVRRGGFVAYVGTARSQAAADIAGKYIFITLR